MITSNPSETDPVATGMLEPSGGEYSDIGYATADGVATVTLNRPARLNALTTTMVLELVDAFDRIDADDDVRAVIVTGAGRGFCAGADLGGGASTFAGQADAERWREERGEIDGVPRDRGGIVSFLEKRLARFPLRVSKDYPSVVPAWPQRPGGC